MAPAPTIFVHFTNRPDAETMVAAGIIGRSRTIVDAVYAVAVGGIVQPGVQHTRTGDRDVAIVFTTTTRSTPRLTSPWPSRSGRTVPNPRSHLP